MPDNLFEAYDDVIDGWLQEGIIELVPEVEEAEYGHYIPHRPVVKTEGTTKIRPVFRACAKEKGNSSLNKSLHKRPNLIEQIPDVLLTFRPGIIGVSADIKKAFLQISVSAKDRDFLRLWYVNGKIRVFRHKRVFGVTSSPFLLEATLEHHFNRMLEKYSDPKYQEIQEVYSLK